ncbi:MAG TPA: hypothetical protein VFW34_06810 [Candidatus Rubrimentiphilum sp.]|nr:hypothetical protein [Candidatus Rubrimentiphilum sp.]
MSTPKSLSFDGRGRAAISLALWENGNDRFLYLTIPNGDIWRENLSNGHLDAIVSFVQIPEQLGAASVLPVSVNRVIYSSNFWDTIYAARFPFPGEPGAPGRPIAGEDGADIVQVGGFQDGPAAASRFFAPFGLATNNIDRIFVADSANRRIRVLEPINWTQYFGGAPNDSRSGGVKRIFLVGDRSVFWNSILQSESIAGLLQEKLHSPVTGVVLPKSTLQDQANRVAGLAGQYAGSTIVWVVDTAAFGITATSQSLSAGAETEAVRIINDAIAHRGSSTVILADHPLGGQLSESDSAFANTYGEPDDDRTPTYMPDGYATNLAIEQLLQKVNTPHIFTLAAFVNKERMPHPPLFQSDWPYFSRAGNVFYANLLAAGLSDVLGPQR